MQLLVVVDIGGFLQAVDVVLRQIAQKQWFRFSSSPTAG
jgi:hypothetical protein